MTNPAPAITTRLFASTMCYILDHLAPAITNHLATQFLCHLSRQTLGYRKWKDLLTYKRIQQLTGWCNDTIHAVINFLLEKKLIARKRCGKTYQYWLTFVDKVEEKSTELSTAPDPTPSFFSTPALCETETQIAVTETIQEKEIFEVVDVISTDLQNNRWGYRLRNVPYLAHRARQLGMTPADLLCLWHDCARYADHPGAFLIWTLQHNGKPPRPVPRKKPNLTHRYWRDMIRAG